MNALCDIDYYPFGMLMPGRSFSSEDYRFGFNGKENDNEVKVTGGQQDYGMRIYDPRLGRFFSVDPLFQQFPELTTYQFASNTPIQAIDMDGLERLHYTVIQTGDNTYVKRVDYTNVKFQSSQQWDNVMLNSQRDIPITKLQFDNISEGKWRDSRNIQGWRVPGGNVPIIRNLSSVLPIPQPGETSAIVAPLPDVPNNATNVQTIIIMSITGNASFNVSDQVRITNNSGFTTTLNLPTAGTESGTGNFTINIELPSSGNYTVSTLDQGVASEVSGSITVTTTTTFTTPPKQTYSGDPGTAGTPGTVD